MFQAVVTAFVIGVAALVRPGADTLESLWPNVEAIRDDAGTQTLADVRAANAPWRPADDLPLPHTATRLRPATVWYRLRVRPVDDEDDVVVVSWHALDAAMYTVRDDGRIDTARSGGDVPDAQKLHGSAQNVLMIPRYARDGRPIYLRVRSAFEHNSVFLIAGERAWLHKRVSWDAYQRPQLLFAGFVAAFGAFNFVLALRLRRTMYAIYAVAVLSATLQVLVLTGDAWRWLWPDLGIDYDLAVVPSYALAIGFAVLFGRTFLRTRRLFPRTDRAIVVLLWLFLAANAAVLYDPEFLEGIGLYDALQAAATAAVLAPLACCAAAAARRRERGAAYYLVGVVGLLVGNVAGLAQNNGILPTIEPLILAPTLGFAWEALLLSVALAERLRNSERDVLVDPLTGLPNRRGFGNALAEEAARAERTHAPYAILMMDVDRFKSYNDRYGHVAGDRALQAVATAFAAALRSTDRLARIGGEEFVALLPATDLAGAVALGERVREAVHAAWIAHEDVPTGYLTVSIGAASAERTETGDVVLARADAALYAAKNGGRDRIATAEPVAS